MWKEIVLISKMYSLISKALSLYRKASILTGKYTQKSKQLGDINRVDIGWGWKNTLGHVGTCYVG